MLSDLVFWHESWTLFTSDCCIRRKNNSNSETYLLIFSSVIEDILVLLKTGLSYSFTSLLSRYSTFSVFLFGCSSCISNFFLWEISSLFIECVANPLYNKVCLDKLVTLLRPVYMRWDILPSETSHLSEIFFIPCLYEKIILPEWDTFHPSYPACLFLMWLSLFTCLFVFISVSIH